MSALTNIQTIKDTRGKPAFVVMPYADFFRMYEKAEKLVPHEIVEAVIIDKATPIRAWREHLRLTQSEVARRMGITQAAFAQIESAEAKPRPATLKRVAKALGITVVQLDF